MTRAVPLWVADHDDQAFPVRVKLRILTRQGHRCAGCGRDFTATCRPEFDHRIALINGGANSEENAQALCEWCHAPKTAEDVALKSTVARKRAKHLGIAPKTRHPLPASKRSPWKKRIDGSVVKREDP